NVLRSVIVGCLTSIKKGKQGCFRILSVKQLSRFFVRRFTGQSLPSSDGPAGAMGNPTSMDWQVGAPPP
ncbi:hypothetical protein ABLO16_01270, partial [Mycobacterium tuberculosis]